MKRKWRVLKVPLLYFLLQSSSFPSAEYDPSSAAKVCSKQEASTFHKRVVLSTVALSLAVLADPPPPLSLSLPSPPQNTVLASFVQCVWALHIVCSGSAKEEAIGESCNDVI